jgi:hypothetical protein
MNNKPYSKQAQKLLPDPETYDGNYIDIHIPVKDGHYVISYAKQEREGKFVWLELPYAR